MEIPRSEYPRPDFMRKRWQTLNGQWDFSFDEPVYDRQILVPFCYQSHASGIGDTGEHEAVWYRRRFAVDALQLGKGSLLLHFGAVDYEATVWINSVYAGHHRGGHTSFCLDITDHIHDGADNELVLRARDSLAADQPRGKQSWTGEPFHCWYTATTGIWQSVWLEYAGDVYLRRVKITPDVGRLQAVCELFLSRSDAVDIELRPEMELDGQTLSFESITVRCALGYGKAVMAFPDLDIRRHQLLWSPEHPNLINVGIRVNSRHTKDEVTTYFGMRQIELRDSVVTLNGDFLYQRLVLDQGYWPDSLLTPPSDEAIIRDIRLAKEMGFNGVRKHQKIEDPRFYYWADKLGLLVWGELPSAYQFNDAAVVNSTRELIEFVQRDYNHPCIVTWVPVNESWGVRDILSNQQQQDYARALLYLVKSIDQSRPVSGNDGWEQISQTDICAIHDYALTPETISKYDDMDRVLRTGVRKRLIYANGNAHTGQPVMMTEYGGVAFEGDRDQDWGYLEQVKSEGEFLERIGPVTHYLRDSHHFCGYCYTQLTDVMQEINGFLVKFPLCMQHRRDYRFRLFFLVAVATSIRGILLDSYIRIHRKFLRNFVYCSLQKGFPDQAFQVAKDILVASVVAVHLVVNAADVAGGNSIGTGK